jgi:hypothetical protein
MTFPVITPILMSTCKKDGLNSMKEFGRSELKIIMLKQKMKPGINKGKRSAEG